MNIHRQLQHYARFWKKEHSLPRLRPQLTIRENGEETSYYPEPSTMDAYYRFRTKVNSIEQRYPELRGWCRKLMKQVLNYVVGKPYCIIDTPKVLKLKSRTKTLPKTLEHNSPAQHNFNLFYYDCLYYTRGSSDLYKVYLGYKYVFCYRSGYVYIKDECGTVLSRVSFEDSRVPKIIEILCKYFMDMDTVTGGRFEGIFISDFKKLPCGSWTYKYPETLYPQIPNPGG